jgi:exodeoxyribonuclease VII large subunit
MDGKMSAALDRDRRRLAVFAERLDGRSPAKKLSSGYAFARLSDGSRLTSVEQVSSGDRLTLSVSDGNIDCEVL